MVDFKLYTENNIDKDFMILWSNYLLSGKMDMERLTALAELGHLEAIQAYYMMSTTKNATIDKIVDALPINIDPSKDYTRNCKYYFENKKDIDGKVKAAGQLYKKYEHDLYKYRAWLYASTSIASLSEELHKIPYFKDKLECAKRMWTTGKFIKDPTLLETAVEINSSVPLVSEFIFNICAKSTRRKLKNACKSNPENMTLKFNLAKNLMKFSSSEKNKTIAKTMLENIATNEYSSLLESKLQGNEKGIE